MIFNTPPKDFNPKVRVAACFIEYADEVLFLHRAEHISQGSTWAIPGGKINKDETPEQAIRREILEECKYELANPIFIQVVYIRYPEYDYEYYMFKEVTLVKPVITIDSSESQDYMWLVREEVEKLEAQNKLILDEMPCIQVVYEDNEFGTESCMVSNN
jgi:8-oxo-dGTP diphosphatase